MEFYIPEYEDEMWIDRVSQPAKYRLPEQVILRWTQECGHEIICDCPDHYVGKLEYCSKCNAWKRLRIWRKYVPATTGDN